MTRDERAAKRAERLTDDSATTSQALAQVEAQQRADARATRDQRRQRVGTLADAAGLLLWDETTLAGLFQILATFRETPDPVAVLEALVGDTSLALTGTAAPAGASFLTAAPASDASTVSTRGGEAALLTGGNN
jgi:hypothetical protein